jgi:outer membrane receptor protein involved in Fe transport
MPVAAGRCWLVRLFACRPERGGIAANLKSNHREQDINESKTKAFDLFGDVTWKVSPQIELGAGLRWTHDDKTTSISDSVLNGRSILGGFLGALSLPEPFRTQLVTALAVPGAATIPPSILFPVPLFGVTFQPTANNGDEIDADNKDEWLHLARLRPLRAERRHQPLCDLRARPPSGSAFGAEPGGPVR